jgi:nitrile hydratase
MVSAKKQLGAVKADGEEPAFRPGESVIISHRFPIGHYRVPQYIRGKRAVIESVIEPRTLNNEEEGFGRNAGKKGHYYRVAIPLADLWPGYTGGAADGLRTEVFEKWLERTK